MHQFNVFAASRWRGVRRGGHLVRYLDGVPPVIRRGWRAVPPRKPFAEKIVIKGIFYKQKVFLIATRQGLIRRIGPI